ncbi:hypothetical protein VQH23_04030 [Pararoseomonas sp. SCSIO 73927]|uniref:hypothetical protein n=1 Tax=Pararoseomonas sp. SCSIO 73927 TaxID=3114537 RepID=UPI0030CC13AC
MATLPAPTAPPAALEAHAIARMCDEAGVPELIVSMLRQPMTLKQVEGQLEEARLILQCGTLMGQPTMGRKLMAAGVSLSTARSLINEAAVQADEAIVTDPTHSGGPPQPSHPRINSAAVYARLNAAQGKG